MEDAAGDYGLTGIDMDDDENEVDDDENEQGRKERMKTDAKAKNNM